MMLSLQSIRLSGGIFEAVLGRARQLRAPVRRRHVPARGAATPPTSRRHGGGARRRHRASRGASPQSRLRPVRPLPRLARRSLGDRAGRQCRAVEMDPQRQLRVLNARSQVARHHRPLSGLARHAVLGAELPAASSTSGNRCPSWRSCCSPGLQRVPSNLYRAAYMDGAGTLEQLPGTSRCRRSAACIGIAIVLQTIWSLRVFDLIVVLTRGGPADGDGHFSTSSPIA